MIKPLAEFRLILNNFTNEGRDHMQFFPGWLLSSIVFIVFTISNKNERSEIIRESTAMTLR